MRGSPALARFTGRKSVRFATAFVVAVLAVTIIQGQLVGRAISGANAAATDVAPNGVGMLDCNGHSPIQKPLRLGDVCTDPRSLYDGKPARFYDNGHYVGHDEPSIRFLSSVPGSANNVTW